MKSHFVNCSVLRRKLRSASRSPVSPTPAPFADLGLLCGASSFSAGKQVRQVRATHLRGLQFLKQRMIFPRRPLLPTFRHHPGVELTPPAPGRGLANQSTASPTVMGSGVSLRPNQSPWGTTWELGGTVQ